MPSMLLLLCAGTDACPGRAVVRRHERLAREEAETINGYIGEIVAMTDAMREETETANRLLRENRYRLAADPTLPYTQPELERSVPHLNFAPLLNAGARLAKEAAAFHETLDRHRRRGRAIPESQLTALNEAIYQTERELISEGRLPRRPWYRHQIYAPGFYTGYGVKTISGVREAIEGRNRDEAGQRIGEASAALLRLTARRGRAM